MGVYFCYFWGIYDCLVLGGVIFWSHSMLILLPAKTIVLMVVLRSELSPRFLYFGGTMCATMRSIWMSLWLFFCRVCLSSCVGYLESGLCIRIECRVWVQFGFEVRCVNTCSYLLQRLVVGRVFTVFFGCCILFLGSAIGWWLFAATVYWMFGSVA